jgi:hypothetical protein
LSVPPPNAGQVIPAAAGPGLTAFESRAADEGAERAVPPEDVQAAAPAVSAASVTAASARRVLLVPVVALMGAG